VADIRYDGDFRRGLVAVCSREGGQHRVSLADVVPGPVIIETSMLLDAYRRWCGIEPATTATMTPVPAKPWLYRPLSTNEVVVATPLALRARGLWDPAEEYLGEPAEERHPVVAKIIAAGVRREFEMEQVIPGIDDDDWDCDPVADAAELHRAGADRQAVAILEDLIAQDERCLDAWVHLGNITLGAKVPKTAVELYDRAVGVGERSLPPDFGGVLPWGLIDNRPFLRPLHGLGLCAWRQRRWADAEQIFLSRAWLEGADTWDAIWCLDRVQARQQWRRE
jgi:hypothetical protein